MRKEGGRNTPRQPGRGHKPYSRPQTEAPGPKPGFQTINWAELDLDEDEEVTHNLILRLRSNVAAKRWAKFTEEGPMPDDLTRQYLEEQVRRHQERVQNDKKRVEASQNAGLQRYETTKDREEARLKDYLALMSDPQPQDVMSFRALASIEVRLQDVQDEINKTTFDTAEELDRRKKLSDEWGVLSNQYREYMKSLGITKGQRDANNEGKTTAELFSDEMKRADKFMAAEMDMPRCSCGVEVAWVWHAFAHVHNPTPYYFIGQCECGKVVEVGDADFAKGNLT